MIKKIVIVDDLVDAYDYLPHLKEMELSDLANYLNNTEEDDDWGGWYWDYDKHELFHPYIVLSEPKYDMVFIMKDTMTSEDYYPRPEIINFEIGRAHV